MILSLVLKRFGISLSKCPFPCMHPLPISDSFVVLIDLLCNHPPCKTIVWQLGSKSVLQFVVLLSSCIYHIVLGEHPWSWQVKSCTKLEGGQVNQEVLYWFNNRSLPQMRSYLPGTKPTFIFASPTLRWGQLNGGESCIVLESWQTCSLVSKVLHCLSCALRELHIASKEYCKRSYGQFVWNLLPEVVPLKHIIVSSADIFHFTRQEFSIGYSYTEDHKKQ